MTDENAKNSNVNGESRNNSEHTCLLLTTYFNNNNLHFTCGSYTPPELRSAENENARNPLSQKNGEQHNFTQNLDSSSNAQGVAGRK